MEDRQITNPALKELVRLIEERLSSWPSNDNGQPSAPRPGPPDIDIETLGAIFDSLPDDIT